MPRFIVGALVVGSILASAGTVLLKLGASGRTTLFSFINPLIVTGLVMYGLGAACWIYGMSQQKLINVYPFTMLTFVIVYLTGVLGLGERPTRVGLVGVALMLLGLVLVARNAA